MLGLASDEERREFEQMCVQHPEVLQARTAFELALEQQALHNALPPAAGTKDRIMTEIGSTGKVVSLPQVTRNWWKYGAAACLLLLAASVYYNISLSGKNRKLETDYEHTVASLDSIKNDVAMLRDNPQIKMASMKGSAVSPLSYATVYWDTTTHDVYLLANNLPQPASGMQYQLWAFLDNKPIDLGMLDYDLKQKKLLVRMKNAQHAQAFAITLEKKDRPDPSRPQGQLYVSGNL